MRIKIKEKDLFKNLIQNNFGLELNEINSFCTDSRKIKKNDIFLPIKGENIDSHKFIPTVLNQGAVISFSEIEFENENYNQELDQKLNNSDEEENINEKLPF